MLRRIIYDSYPFLMNGTVSEVEVSNQQAELFRYVGQLYTWVCQGQPQFKYVFLADFLIGKGKKETFSLLKMYWNNELCGHPGLMSSQICSVVTVSTLSSPGSNVHLGRKLGKVFQSDCGCLSRWWDYERCYILQRMCPTFQFSTKQNEFGIKTKTKN